MGQLLCASKQYNWALFLTWITSVRTTASSALIKHGFVNRSSYWYFTGSASLFCCWTTSSEPVTTRAASMQYNFVLQVKPQDTLLPQPHGQLAPCLVTPPIAVYDEVCARWINFILITDNWWDPGTVSHCHSVHIDMDLFGMNVGMHWEFYDVIYRIMQ